VVSRDAVPAGTGLAVSPDGSELLTYMHTTAGAVLNFVERSSGHSRRLELTPPALPPGVQWRIFDATFSPSGAWVAVRSTGQIWVIDTAKTQVAFSIGTDKAGQFYPGKLSWGGNQLAVPFWPPESYLADAAAKKPVEVRIYDAASGQITHRVSLPLPSADAWTVSRLSPDGAKLAVLLRARRWPGKADLLFASVESGKAWQEKISAEDIHWSSDGKQVLALGNELVWLNAEDGKAVRKIATGIHHSEYQKLRVNEAAQIAAGEFTLYSPFKRMLHEGKTESSRLILWRLDTEKELCEVPLDAATDAEIWLTSSGEIVTLETSYEIRPPLRLPKSARIVTYRVAAPNEPAKPAAPQPTPHSPF
jgi:WD40 repeat protein